MSEPTFSNCQQLTIKNRGKFNTGLLGFFIKVWVQIKGFCHRYKFQDECMKTAIPELFYDSMKSVLLSVS